MDLGRRDFLRASAIAGALAALGGAPATVEKRNGMPYRTLGKTGEKVSLLCVGGYHIGQKSVSDEDSIRMQRTALDEGVNFLDNAYIYNDGRSEELMGKALRDGYRDKAFLMTKHFTDERDAASVKQQLEASLRRLQTDVIDLWQVHQVIKADHPRGVYENGIMDVMTKAREEGKIRYIGFTGHARPEFLQEMLDRGFDWDTVQMPVNAFDHHWTSFQKAILPQALKKDMGVIGMKTLGGSPGQFVNRANLLTAEECLRYTMNLPVSTVVSGMDTMERLQANIATAKRFEPLDEEEVKAILAKCAEAAQGGKYEPYKHKELA
jgi:predicted aldo/keto reductase-like oxidoreductase